MITIAWCSLHKAWRHIDTSGIRAKHLLQAMACLRRADLFLNRTLRSNLNESTTSFIHENMWSILPRSQSDNNWVDRSTKMLEHVLCNNMAYQFVYQEWCMGLPLNRKRVSLYSTGNTWVPSRISMYFGTMSGITYTKVHTDMHMCILPCTQPYVHKYV